MTRINAKIKVTELCDQMLIGEHREIKRIPNTIKTGKAVVKDTPKNFKLGAGHVVFFYDKLGYLHKRYNLILEECKNRGFSVTDYNSCFENLPIHLYNDWKPSNEVRSILVERINERLDTMKNIRFYSETYDKKYLKL